MNNAKTTKRALLSSVMAMLICVVMLIGTTFAWFTDTASTAVNKIQAGKLDIALEMKTGTDTEGNSIWVNAEGQTLSWVKAAGAPSEEKVLWEPGCTYALQDVRIVNQGNLALKYKIAITGIDGDAQLNDVIEWTINGTDLNNENKLSGGQSHVLTIKGNMQKTAGNEYQGLAIDGIGITVVATQDTVEYDSTDNQYDATAEYPIAVAANVTVVGNRVSEEVTVESAEKVTGTDISVAKVYIPENAAVLNDTNQLKLAIEKVATPANFVVNDGESTKSFEIHVEGLDENNTEPLIVSIYVEENLADLMLIHNGTPMVKDTDNVLEDGEYTYDPDNGILKFATSTFSPFTVVYSDEPEKGTFDDYDNTAVFEIGTADDLFEFARLVNEEGKSFIGKTIKLTADIDMENKTWTPVGQTGSTYGTKTFFQGTFDGDGKTVSNLNIPISTWQSGDNSGKYFATGFFGYTEAGSTAIKNVIFDNATVEGHHWVAVVAGYMTGTVENVTVSNSNVTATVSDIINAAGDKVGGLIGYLNSGTIKNNKVENCTVNSYWDAGGIAGAVALGATFTGNIVSDTTVTYQASYKYNWFKPVPSADKIVGPRTGFTPDSSNIATNVTVSKK